MSGCTDIVVDLRGVRKTYGEGPGAADVLHDVSAVIRKGEFVAICGPSGSGKSTLMNIIGLLDRDYAGSYHAVGRLASSMSASQAADFRLSNIGFVFQQFNLLGHLTASENIQLPMTLANVPARSRARRTQELLDWLGLSGKGSLLPSQLSGGQQQRIALARAICRQPALLIADEPTGSLDSSTGAGVMELIERLNKQDGATVVLVTHDSQVAARADRVITIRDGRIENDH